MDQFEKEAREILDRYDSSIIEDSISYESGLLKCMSNKYKFEINPTEFKAFNRKTDFEEFRYSHKFLISSSSDPSLLESARAINAFLSEYNALTLVEIVE